MEAELLKSFHLNAHAWVFLKIFSLIVDFWFYRKYKRLPTLYSIINSTT